jgi:hypothetical protein
MDCINIADATGNSDTSRISFVANCQVLFQIVDYRTFF